MCGALIQHVRGLCTFVEERCEPCYWHPLYIKTMMTNPLEKAYHSYHQHLLRSISSPPNIHHLPPKWSSSPNIQHPTIFLLLSTHKLQHLRGRDESVHNHRQKKPCVTDGWGGEGSGVVQPSVYQGTHNQGNPFGRYRRKPSDKICRKMRYGLQAVNLQS